MNSVTLAPELEHESAAIPQAAPAVSVIVPVYNEERTIEEILRRVTAVFDGQWEIIVVNDGSTDDTGRILARYGEPRASATGVFGEPSGESRRVAPIRVLQHPRNQGKGAAVRTGLAHASGDIVVIQDADLEYDPADLPRLLEAFDDPKVQAVYGARYGPTASPLSPAGRGAGGEGPSPHSVSPQRVSPQRQQGFSIFRLAVALLNGLVWLLYGRRLHDEATCYKIVRRSLLNSFELHSNGFELCADITGKLCARGIPITERPISYQRRGYGDGKKIGLGAFFRCVWELVRCRFAGLREYLPSRWVWLAVVIIGVVGGLALGRIQWFAGETRNQNLVESGLVVAPTSLDFGQAWETTKFEWPVTFSNTGATPIGIERFDTSCQCAKVTVERLELAPGEQKTVTTSLDLTRDKPVVRSAPYWTAVFALRAQWTDGTDAKRHTEWVIHGRVKPLIAVEPGIVRLGDELIRGKTAEPRTAVIRPLVSVSAIELRAVPVGLACTITRKKNDYELMVTATDKLPAGFTSLEVGLALSAPNGESLPVQTLRVLGTVDDKIIAVPHSLPLGPVRIGDSVAETITLRAPGGETFEIAKVDLPPATKLVGQERVGKDWQIRLQHHVAAAGHGSAALAIQLRFASGETLSIPVCMVWFGVAE